MSTPGASGQDLREPPAPQQTRAATAPQRSPDPVPAERIAAPAEARLLAPSQLRSAPRFVSAAAVPRACGPLRSVASGHPEHLSSVLNSCHPHDLKPQLFCQSIKQCEESGITPPRRRPEEPPGRRNPTARFSGGVSQPNPPTPGGGLRKPRLFSRSPGRQAAAAWEEHKHLLRELECSAQTASALPARFQGITVYRSYYG